MADEADRGERQSDRRKVILAGAVIIGGRHLPCQVRDLSSGGARVCLGETLPLGTPVHLELPRHGRFPAVVAWVKGGLAGLAFPEGPGFALARFGDAAARLGLVDSDADD